MAKRGRKKAAHSNDLLSMALVGYESAKKDIEQKISEIRKMIVGGGRAIAAAVESVNTPKKRRKLSAKARRAISMAQKKRWSEARKATKTTVKKVKATAKKAVKAAKAKAAGVVPF